MSNIMIYDIVGTGIYAVPGGVVAAQQATAGLRALLAEVAGLAADSINVRAWILDSQTASGGEGVRSLACLVGGFTYNGEVCPSEAEVDTLTAAIRSALLAASGGGTITSIGVQEVNLFDGGYAPGGGPG
jgi:hypothetical protein